MADKELGTVFPDGEIIFRQGDAADCLYFIQSGKVVIYQEKDGNEVPLAELGKGDSFGDMGVFMGPIRTESARSLGGVRVITADYKFVLKKFRDDPSFAFQIIETMAQRDRARTEVQEKVVEGLHLHQKELTAQNLELKDAGQTAEESRDKNADSTISRRSAPSTWTKPVSSGASTWRAQPCWGRSDRICWACPSLPSFPRKTRIYTGTIFWSASALPKG